MTKTVDIFKANVNGVKLAGFEAINAPSINETEANLAMFRASEFCKSSACLTMANNANLVSASSLLDNAIMQGKASTLPKMAHLVTTAIAKAGGRTIKYLMPKVVGHIRYMAGVEKSVFRNIQVTEAQKLAHYTAFMPLALDLQGQGKDMDIRAYINYLDNLGRTWTADGKDILAEDKVTRAQALTMGAWLNAGKPTK